MNEAHELLVRARNGIAREGYDVGSYALDDCGSPRCVLGWCGVAAGIQHDFYLFRPAGAYREALAALWECRPCDPDPEIFDPTTCPAARVEDVAFQLARDNHLDPAGELAAVLAWFDNAIGLTAPPPPDVPYPVEVCETTRLVTL
jgi:hypothetical protein